MSTFASFKIGNNLIQLQPLNENHLDLFKIIQNDRKVLDQYQPGTTAIKTKADALNFLKQVQIKTKQGKILWLTILKNEKVVGEIVMHHINHQDKNTKIGYFLSTKAQGQGIMTKTVKVLINVAFSRLHLHKISFEIAASNQKSLAIAKRLGFVYEATLKEQMLISGKYQDEIIYSVFNRK